MSVNPLQGIQVINSVNPCSSTPLHQPIYPYHYRAFPPLAEPHPAAVSPSPSPLSPFLRSLATPRRSIYPIQLESRLTSPPWSTPQTTRTLGKSRKLRLQRLFCARRAPNPQNPWVLLASFFSLLAVFTPFFPSSLSLFPSLSRTSLSCPFYAPFFEDCSRISLPPRSYPFLVHAARSFPD